MKNIGASVSAVLAREKKPVAAVAEEGIEEEERHQMRNEMVFYLREAPEYRISAVAEWCENSRGDILTAEPDTYFLHVLTGARCESVWFMSHPVVGTPGEGQEKWDTLCEQIDELENIEQIMCDEESFAV